MQPEKKFKVGACIASVFKNEVETMTGKRVVKRVILKRVYKDREGFKYATGLRPEDVSNAITVLQQAEDYLAGDGSGE